MSIQSGPAMNPAVNQHELAGLFDPDIVSEVVLFIGEETYGKLLADFSVGLGAKLEELRNLVAEPQEDNSEAMRIAHRLKGAAHALGLRDFAETIGLLANRNGVLPPQPVALSIILELLGPAALLEAAFTHQDGV